MDTLDDRLFDVDIEAISQGERTELFRKRKGNRCEECGTTESLTAHHNNFDGGLRRAKIGEDQEYVRILRNWYTKEFELLCRSCNSKRNVTHPAFISSNSGLQKKNTNK